VWLRKKEWKKVRESTDERATRVSDVCLYVCARENQGTRAILMKEDLKREKDRDIERDRRERAKKRQKAKE